MSSPSMISATFVSGTCIRSSYVARRLGWAIVPTIAPCACDGATAVPSKELGPCAFVIVPRNARPLRRVAQVLRIRDAELLDDRHAHVRTYGVGERAGVRVAGADPIAQ